MRLPTASISSSEVPGVELVSDSFFRSAAWTSIELTVTSVLGSLVLLWLTAALWFFTRSGIPLT